MIRPANKDKVPNKWWDIEQGNGVWKTVINYDHWLHCLEEKPCWRGCMGMLLKRRESRRNPGKRVESRKVIVPLWPLWHWGGLSKSSLVPMAESQREFGHTLWVDLVFNAWRRACSCSLSGDFGGTPCPGRASWAAGWGTVG